MTLMVGQALRPGLQVGKGQALNPCLAQSALANLTARPLGGTKCLGCSAVAIVEHSNEFVNQGLNHQITDNDLQPHGLFPYTRHITTWAVFTPLGHTERVYVPGPYKPLNTESFSYAGVRLFYSF